MVQQFGQNPQITPNPTPVDGKMNGVLKRPLKSTELMKPQVNTSELKFSNKYIGLNDPVLLRKLLEIKEDINFETILLHDFFDLKWNHPKFEKSGLTLLKNFGSLKPNSENLDKLLRSVGFSRKVRNYKKPTYEKRKVTAEAAKNGEKGIEKVSENTEVKRTLLSFGTRMIEGRGGTSIKTLITHLEALDKTEIKITVLIRNELTNSNPKIRWAAIKALSGFNDEEAVDDLKMRSMKDISKQVRLAAVNAVTEFKIETAVSASIELLRETKDPQVRWAAASGLIRNSEVGVLDKLIPSLDHKKPDVRLASMWVLTQIGLTEILEKVEKMAKKDPNRELRKEARKILLDRVNHTIEE